jgi:hypothetical protein
MTGYAYIHPEPFKRVLRYDYAPCASASFLMGWQEAREGFRQRLKTVSYQAQAYPQEKGSLTYYLEKSRNDEDLIWAFIKKYEVFGRFYNAYDENLRKASHATEATFDDYLMFAEILVMYAENRECLQYLSTLLKVIDAFCGLGQKDLAQVNSESLLKLLEQERVLVQQLEKTL